MKFFFAIFLIVAAFNTMASTIVLKVYESDGCTMFPDGTLKEPNLWRHCCDLHDLRYWFGGTKEDELQADQNLRSCVMEVAGPFVAKMMYAGVRTGHYSPIKNKYKWGWGWTNRTPWLELSEDEKIIISEELDKLNLDEPLRAKMREDYSL